MQVREATSGIAVRDLDLSVANAAMGHDRLAASGLKVTELRRFECSVEFFELTDPDGNATGFVTELD